MSSYVAWKCIAEADPAEIAPAVYRGALIGALEEIDSLMASIRSAARDLDREKPSDAASTLAAALE